MSALSFVDDLAPSIDTGAADQLLEKAAVVPAPAPVTLTPMQMAAVEAPIDLPLRILAPAGSGKTQVLARRYAYLVEQGVDVKCIVAVTFNRTMADELLTRILRYTPAACKEQICTIHALCYRILRAEGDPRQVAKEWQVKQAIEEAAAAVCLDAGWKEIEYWLAVSKGAGVASTDTAGLMGVFSSRLTPVQARALVQIRRMVDEALKRQNLITFNDMLLEVELRLRGNAAFRSSWQDKFSYVIIDEAQDVTRQSMYILSTLAEPENYFTAIGDTDQLMYRFTGATPEANLFDGFDSRYPGGTTIKLDRNFRSTRQIVASAARVIEHNYQRGGGEYSDAYYKEVFPRDGAPDGCEIAYAPFEFPEGEAGAVVRQIRALMDAEKRTPDHFFVAARTRAQLAFLESPLVSAKVPFINLCGGSFWSAKHVADVVGYLELALTGGDEAFAQVFDVASKSFTQPFNCPTRRKGQYCPTRYLGKAFMAACHGHYAERWTACDVDAQGWRWRAGIQDLDQLVDDINYTLQERGYIEALRFIVDQYMSYLMAQGVVEADVAENGKKEDFDTLLQVARDFEGEGENAASAFLAHVHECQQASRDESWEGKVVLSTVHRLKGLERPVMFGIGLSQGLLPHKSALGGMPPMGKLPTGVPGIIADERCLFYVLVTRARERVFLSSIRFWRKDDFGPSMFLAEMGIDAGDAEGGEDLD